jgi:flagellar biosynthesis protein FlhF
MKVFQFIAESAPEAVEQIRRQLGPNAVVLNVRKLPASGISRLWSKSRIEVLAGIKGEENQLANKPVMSGRLDTFDEPVLGSGIAPTDVVSTEAPRVDDVLKNPAGPEPKSASLMNGADLFHQQADRSVAEPIKMEHGMGQGWQLESMLLNMGLAPLHAHRVVDQLRTRHGSGDSNLRREISQACALLAELWEEKPFSIQSSSVHVFVGPAGSGKTTALCKWLTQATLLAGHSAQVWRLDGATANTAESLSVYGEILGVPVARSLSFDGKPPVDVAFIDLPGVDWNDASAVRDLAVRLTELPAAQVHLVLNAAYESSILVAQAKAFMCLPIQDIVLTHLDEELRWGKLWNLVLGTNYRIGWLSAGQNIPGTFKPASPGEVLARQFSMNC